MNVKVGSPNFVVVCHTPNRSHWVLGEFELPSSFVMGHSAFTATAANQRSAVELTSSEKVIV
jgi:hypothetical protein